MKILRHVFVGALLLTGCSVETPKQRYEREHAKQVRSETKYGEGSLLTVEHDGHLFIVEGRWQKGAMIHHPDCKCRQQSPVRGE